MDKMIEEALNETMGFIAEYRSKYKDVKGMEPLLAYLDETEQKCEQRHIKESLDADWLKAVCSDIKLKEFRCKTDAGLLTSGESSAKDAIKSIFNGKSDLPDDVK